MQQMNKDDLLTQPHVPVEQALPMTTPPQRSRLGMRTTSIVALAVVLVLVLGVGLFAGWVYGTRGTGTGVVSPATSPATTVPPVTITSNTLDAVREAVVAKVRPTVVQKRWARVSPIT